MSFRPSQIPILEVLDACGIQYKKKWSDEYWLYEHGEMTSWWSASVDRNHVTDFSHDRAEWDAFAFVRSYYRYDDAETFQWLSDKFPSYNPQKETVMDVWRWLPTLSQEHIDYLSSRGIKYDLVKRYVREYKGIACIVTNKWNPAGINARTLSTDHSKRFTAYPWYSTSWVYQWMIDKSKGYIIVVEWLIDFLSIVQYDSNVIWLKSVQDGRWQVREYARYMDVYIVFDNDDIGKESEKNMTWLAYYKFDRSYLIDCKCKDANDLLVKMELWDGIVEGIKNASIFVSPQIHDLKKRRSYTRGIRQMDDLFGKVADNDLVIVSAGTNQWKTTFVNYMANANGSQGKKVAYMTIELNPMIIKERYAFSCLWISKDDYNAGNYTEKQKEAMVRIINNYEKSFDLIGFDKAPSIDQLCEMILAMKEKWYSLFIIDNLWNINAKGNELDQQKEITDKLQNLKNNNDLCIILIHHNNKVKKNEDARNHSLANIRWNQKIADNANIVVEISRHYDDVTGISNTKITQHKDTMWWVSDHVYLEYKSGNFIFSSMRDDK